MGRISSPPDTTFDDNASSGGGADLGFHSIRDRLRFKRNPNPKSTSNPGHDRGGGAGRVYSDRAAARGRSHAFGGRSGRRGIQFCPVKGKSALYLVVISAVFLFVTASVVLQSSITSVFRQGGGDRGRMLREGLRMGTTLRFVPGRHSRQFSERIGLDRRWRNQPQIAHRRPRLALVSVN